MEVRGSVTDRPWGLTLGAIALRRHTGQLTVDSDGKRYSIAFQDGAVVAANSPQAADAIARIALTNHFITSTQVADLTRRLALSAERDEVDVLADAIRFTPDQALKLRHRLVAQRAARTFSLERGDFVLDDRVTLPVHPGVAVDHRHVIYLGVRTNLSEQRLLDDLRQLGSHFTLKPEALDDLPRYGFEPNAHLVLEALKLGTSLPELEAAHRELDPRFAQAVIYSLVSCTACVIRTRTTPVPDAGRAATRAGTGVRTFTRGPRAIDAREPQPIEAPRRSRRDSPPPPTARGASTQPPLAIATAAFHGATGAPAGRSPTPPSGSRTTSALSGSRTTSSPFAARTSTGSPSAYASITAQDSGTNTPAATRPRTSSDTRTRSSSPTPPPPLTTAPAAPPAATPTASAIQTTPPPRPSTPPPRARTETDDGPRFSDSATPAPPAAARASTTAGPPPARPASASRPAVARTVTPNDAVVRGFTDQRTPSGGFSDQRTPRDQRTPTDPSLTRTSTGSPVPSRVSTDNAATAEEAFRRGELAMKRDQPGEAILEFKTACDLNPADVDYAGMLAWAKFCAAGDKAAIGAETRKALERAVFKSVRPERARFYLGRVERMLGRDKEALRHFHEVLDLKPNHADAASEVRAIEARLQAARTGGLFSRKR